MIDILFFIAFFISLFFIVLYYEVYTHRTDFYIYRYFKGGTWFYYELCVDVPKSLKFFWSQNPKLREQSKEKVVLHIQETHYPHC